MTDPSSHVVIWGRQKHEAESQIALAFSQLTWVMFDG
jgi:hypothetical protein